METNEHSSSEEDSHQSEAQFHSTRAEPVLEAAISSLKEKQREGESRKDYERRMAAVDRLGMQESQIRDTGSISQHDRIRGTRFMPQMNPPRDPPPHK